MMSMLVSKYCSICIWTFVAKILGDPPKGLKLCPRTKTQHTVLSLKSNALSLTPNAMTRSLEYVHRGSLGSVGCSASAAFLSELALLVSIEYQCESCTIIYVIMIMGNAKWRGGWVMGVRPCFRNLESGERHPTPVNTPELY